MESINRRDGAHRLKSDLSALPLFWGPGCLSVACLDINLACLGESVASQSPGSWQAHSS